jgi:hypothetical protein
MYLGTYVYWLCSHAPTTAAAAAVSHHTRLLLLLLPLLQVAHLLRVTR